MFGPIILQTCKSGELYWAVSYFYLPLNLEIRLNISYYVAGATHEVNIKSWPENF